MADSPVFYAPIAGKKRARADDGDDDDGGFDALECPKRLEKKARPTSGDSSTSNPWSQAQDSVLNTPKSVSHPDARNFPTQPYDSDDQDSILSEHGSPQDVSMSSGDEDMADNDAAFLISQNGATPRSSLPTEPWQTFHTRAQQHTHRVPTPFIPPSPSRLGAQPAIQVRTSVKQHVRHRHPQEILSNSSDLLEVPSPIDEDEVPTPPSAAEAAGSQLSMLTVNDMDMEPSDAHLPVISVDGSQALPFGNQAQRTLETDSAISDAFEPGDSVGELGAGLVVRKQRARSGALSSGHGSPSPSHAEPARADQNGCGGGKRGFSMGFRAECEKCRMRVPGHMNHFVS